MNHRTTAAVVVAAAGALGISLAALPSALASTGSSAAPLAATCSLPADPTGVVCPSDSPSPSASASPSPSASASASPSASASASASPSPSASASPSPSCSPSPGPAGLPVGGTTCPTDSPTPTASASPSPSASPAAQQTRLTWSGDDAIGYGDAVFAAATLTTAAGRPLAGRSVTFTVGHDSAQTTTDSDGLAYAVLPGTGATGSVAALATFGGDARDQASSSRAGISVHARSTGLRAVESGHGGRYAEVVTVLLGADYARGAYGADERSGIGRLRGARVEVRVGRGHARTYTCDAYGRLQLRGLTRGEAVTLTVLPSRGRWGGNRVRLVAGRGGVRDLPRTTGR